MCLPVARTVETVVRLLVRDCLASSAKPVAGHMAPRQETHDRGR